MKYGIRTPSIKKSVKARTTGRAKRAVKSTINPTYGKKGTGYIKNPKKAVYNTVYKKTTYDATKPIKDITTTTKSNSNRKISALKVGLGIYTCGLSLLFTGVHKKDKNK